MATPASTSAKPTKKGGIGMIFSVVIGIMLAIGVVGLLIVWVASYFFDSGSNTATSPTAAPSVASRSNPKAMPDICNGVPTAYRLLPGESLNLQGCGRNIYNITGGKLPVGYVGGGTDLLAENDTPRGQIAEIRGPQTGAISFMLLACPRPRLANPITKKCDNP